MATASATLVIVEDQSVIATWLQLRLERLGYSVLDTAADASQAIAKAGVLGPDLVLMDVHLGGGSDGIAAAQQIRERQGIPVILVTGSVDDATQRRARDAGVDGFIQKPFDERQLHTAIQTALTKRRMELAHGQPAGAAPSAPPVDSPMQPLLHKLNNELAVAVAPLELLQTGDQLPAVPRDQLRTAQARLTAAAQVTAQLQRMLRAPSRQEAPAACVPESARTERPAGAAAAEAMPVAEAAAAPGTSPASPKHDAAA